MNPKAQLFVDSVFRRKEEDSSFRSRMRGAGSAVRETAVWGDLAPFCNLENENLRAAYVLIGNSVAFEDKEVNGTQPFGRLLSLAWGNEKDAKLVDDQKQAQHPAAARLRRLLVCRDVPELCRVLRPCLRLIRSRRPGELDYAQLLDDLLRFPFDPDKVKARWVMDFSHSVLGKKEQAAEEAEKGEAHE